MLSFILDIRDYLTCDLKLSDVALNDLFSEFDLNPNDFPYFDPSTNTNIYPQQSIQTPSELPPPYDTVLHSTTPNSNIQAEIDQYLSSNTLKSLIEQHQSQQTIVKYSTSPPPSVPIHQANYPEVIEK